MIKSKWWRPYNTYLMSNGDSWQEEDYDHPLQAKWAAWDGGFHRLWHKFDCNIYDNSGEEFMYAPMPLGNEYDGVKVPYLEWSAIVYQGVVRNRWK